MAWLRYPLIALASVAINGFLYLLVPYLQVHTHGAGSKPKVETVEREVVLNPYQPEHNVKRTIEEIKPVSLQKPEKLTASRPSNPNGGLKIDLSPAGGNGPALVSGQNRTGGLGGSGIGEVGTGNGQMTYEMGATDTDAKLTGPDPAPQFPKRAQRNGISGFVELAFVVDEFGRVDQITVLKEEPPGEGFAQEAIKTAKQLRFKPATLQKMAVRQHFRRRFNFDL